MANVQAAKRYARALFELAREQGRLDAVHADLMAIADVIGGRREQIMALIEPYGMTPENRKKLWRAVLGDKSEPLVLRFIEFIIDKGRNPALADMIEAFTRLYNEAKNILAVEIRAAHELEPRQVDAITQRLTQRFGKKIDATVKVDHSLIGGFQVRVGDVVYDYSINHQLDTLHRILITA